MNWKFNLKLQQRVEVKLRQGFGTEWRRAGTQHHSSQNFTLACIYTRKRNLKIALTHVPSVHVHGWRGVVWFWSGPEARRQCASDVSLSRPHSVAMQLESVNRDPYHRETEHAFRNANPRMGGRDTGEPEGEDAKKRKRKTDEFANDWRQNRRDDEEDRGGQRQVLRR